MSRDEVTELLEKIKVHYRDYEVTDRVIDEWYNHLKNYDKADVEQALDYHLKSEKYGAYPPKLYLFTKHIPTIETKERAKGDYVILCDLCGREMTLTEYNLRHRDKCFWVYAVIRLLKKFGTDVSYEELDIYDYLTILRIYDKYKAKGKEIEESNKRVL